jgi:hypothetical protein
MPSPNSDNFSSGLDVKLYVAKKFETAKRLGRRRNGDL